ncbi:MAG: hypothetical protein QM766_20585 [Burkholderiaceae bacterium]
MIVSEATALFIDDGWLAAGIVLWIAAIAFFGAAVAVSPARNAEIFSLGLAALLGISAGRRAVR